MDFNLNTQIQKPVAPISSGAPLQITKPTAAKPAPTTAPITETPTVPKASIFAVKKENSAMLDKMSSDTKGVPGGFAGISSFIDGYLRIAKRSYGGRR